MATFGRERRTAFTGLLVTVQVLFVVFFTAVEAVALGLWLAIVADASLVSTATAVGLGVLAVGLVVEHVFTEFAVNGVSISFSIPAVVGVSVSETVIWGVWLGAAELLGGVDGVLLAGGLLAVFLIPQHTVEDNVLRGERALSRVFDLGTVGFSAVEAAGATAWLLFAFHGSLVRPAVRALGLTGVGTERLGLVVLAGALFVEHVIGVTFTKRG